MREERLGEKGGAFFNGKEGRDDFRTIQWYRLHHYRPLFSKLFNPLFLFQRANKQLSILLGYDIAIQALNYHLAFIGCMNHAVLAFIQSDAITYAAAI